MKKVAHLAINSNLEGSAWFLPAFEKLDTLAKLDLLQNWIYELQCEYDGYFAIFKQEMDALRPTSTEHQPS